MQCFDKKVLLALTLVFSGWLHTVGAYEMATCPPTVSEDESRELLAQYAVNCAEAALETLERLNVDPLNTTVVVEAAKLTIRALDFLEDADNQDANVDEAEAKYEAALDKTRKKLQAFLDPQKKSLCQKVLNNLSELDSELPLEVKESACDEERGDNSLCKWEKEKCICPRKAVRKSMLLKAKCVSLGEGRYECYGVCEESSKN